MTINTPPDHIQERLRELSLEIMDLKSQLQAARAANTQLAHRVLTLRAALDAVSRYPLTYATIYRTARAALDETEGS